MKRRVLIVGHADCDGHVIAEQTRRNFDLIRTFDVNVVVDPNRTRDHRAWTHLDRLPEIEGAELVFFVDMMFAPTSYVNEAESLVSLARSRPKTKFFVIDHHPLPERRLAMADNIRAVYRPDVFECTYGPRSGLMVLAAICENQRRLITNICKPYHDVLALGLKRAAAIGGELGGPRLLNLLRTDRWDVLYALGVEDRLHHRFIRGKRLANMPKSAALLAAEQLARPSDRPSLPVKPTQDVQVDSENSAMPFDISGERFVRTGTEPPNYQNAPVLTKDLEALVTLLEIAAISLTNTPSSTFTREQLFNEAREIGGTGLEIDDRDIEIVLDKATFLRARSGKFSLR